MLTSSMWGLLNYARGCGVIGIISSHKLNADPSACR